MRGRLTFLALLLLALAVPLYGHSQVRIDDRDVLLDSGSTLEGAIASGEVGRNTIVDVNPAEAGSTTAGLQEALARCNGGTGKCTLQLRPNTTYTIPARSTWTGTTADCGLELDAAADDVWLRGGGPSTVLSFSDNIGATAALLICARPGVARPTISDFTIAMTATCTTGCTAATMGAIWAIGDVQDLIVERMRLLATRTITSDASSSTMYNVYLSHDLAPTPDTMPARARIRNNFIQVGGRGIQAIACDLCEFSGNSVNFDGVGADGSSPGSYGGIAVYEGLGNRVVNNVIDERRDGDATVSYMGGILLHRDLEGSAAADENRGTLVAANQIIGLRKYEQIGIWMLGVQNASIKSNTVQAGVCSASATRSCQLAEDCADLGGTCDAVNAHGVYFDTIGGANSAQNTGNSFVGNHFFGFTENTGCPIRIDAPGSDPTGNTRNLISGNLFGMSVLTDDGICGDAARIALNQIENNWVPGSTITKPVRVLDRDFVPALVRGNVEGAGQTVVYTFAVPANTIGTVGALRCQLRGLFVNPTTAGSGLVMRIRWGGATIYQNVAITGTQVSPGMPLTLEFTLANLSGLTNSQAMGGTFSAGNPTAPTNGQGYLVGGGSIVMYGSLRATAAVDTTAAQTLDVSFAIGGTASDNVLTIDSVTLELL